MRHEASETVNLGSPGLIQHFLIALHTFNLSRPMLFCHFLNSLSQLRIVFSGHTTSAVLNFKFSDSSTVWRNVTTCNHSTAMWMKAQTTEDRR